MEQAAINRHGASFEKEYERGDGSSAHAIVHGVALPEESGLSLAVLFDTEAQVEFARHAHVLTSIGSFVHGEERSADTFVEQIRDHLQGELGLTIDVEWSATTAFPRSATGASPINPKTSDLETTDPAADPADPPGSYPIEVFGRRVGTLRIDGDDGRARSAQTRQLDDAAAGVLASIIGLGWTNNELAASGNRYRSLVEPSPDAVSRISPAGILLDANPTALRHTGHADIIGKPLLGLIRQARAEMVLAQVQDVVATGRPSVVWREWMHPEGQDAGWFVFRFAPEFDEQTGEVAAVHLVVSEITELVENEQRLESMALLDPLTGVANRAAVFDRIQHAFDRMQRGDGGLAIAICDLDHFKAINDTFGHGVGDEALCAASVALTRSVRPPDTVGRLGGDEFILVFEDVDDAETAAELGERVRKTVADCRVGQADGHDIALSSSIGIAWTARPVEVHEIVARADRAMYEAKRRGRGRSFVAGAVGDQVDAHIASATIGLAGSLSLDVVAEGVETDAQAEWLVGLGCTLHQGWRYSTALPPDEVVDLRARGPLLDLRVDANTSDRPS